MPAPDNYTKTGGFVLAADEGQPFWFLNCLAININSDDSGGLLTITDHRMPARFAPPHIYQASDEAFPVMDGEPDEFYGEQAPRARPGSLVYLPHAIPHDFTVSGTSPGRIS